MTTTTLTAGTPLTPGPDMLRAVADAIEAEPSRYNQQQWVDEHPDCGTAYCVAGWACALHYGDLTITDDGIHSPDGPLPSHIENIAAGLIDIPDLDTYQLFDEHWLPKQGMSAPEALRRIADGEPLATVSQGTWCDDCDEWHHDGWCDADPDEGWPA